MRLLTFFTFLLAVTFCFTQSKIPLSRADSALVANQTTRFESNIKKNDTKEACRSLDKIALLYWEHNYFSEAIQHYQKSVKLNETIGNQHGIASINSNLALIYADKGDYQLAYDYFEKTLAVRKANGEKYATISALINESVVLNKLSKFDLSINKLNEALTLAQSVNDESQMRSVFGMLSETYQKKGDNEKALYYYEFYRSFNEYVTEKEISEVKVEVEKQRLQKKLLRLENENKRLELEKKGALISAQKKEIVTIHKEIETISQEQKVLIDSLSEKEMSLAIIKQRGIIDRLEKEALLEIKTRQKNALILTVVALSFVVALMIRLIFMFKQKKKLVKLLNYNNELITSSITYAQRIQEAILSGSTPLHQLVVDHTLVYRPRNIVSGDFYYFKTLKNKQKIIVVGDCTGHGVPGAFLTILGSNILDTIIYDHNITRPAEILSELDKQFYHMLNHGNDDVTDGMDVSICLINEANTEIEFSSARNNLVIIQENEHQLIRGTKTSIGLDWDHTEKSFESHTVSINERSWVYMFSDGIQDQFGPDLKKFSRRKLIETLQQSFHCSGTEQQKIVLDKIDKWQGKNEQTDDIILVGLLLP